MAVISYTPNDAATKGRDEVRSIVFKTVENYHGYPLYFLSFSGIAQLGRQAVGKEREWNAHSLRIKLQLPLDKMELLPKPTNEYYVPRFRAKHWTVYAALSHVDNEGAAIKSGYAVDAFWLKDPQNMNFTAEIEVRIAARENDGFIKAVNFQLDLLLAFREYRRVVIN